jgi:peptide deformylase
MIITDKEQLKQICEPCESIEEGEKIGAQLLKELETKGIGLAANQIGINKRVCVINVKEPVVLINPEIIEKSEEKFAFMEGCLSFPLDTVKTQRYKWVKVKADNHEQTLYFTIWHDDSEEGYDKDKYLETAYETACVQHEIDHLDGITMHDRELVLEPWKRRDEKIGRNHKVLVAKGTDSKVIKYKKFDKMKEDGWVLVEV